MDSLAALVQVTLHKDPVAGDVYVFRSRRSDRVKLLLWDGTGRLLLSKRLERGRFHWPPVSEGILRLAPVQLSVLLAGLLEDGRVEIDSNSIERRHRVVATVRRNSLFAGSDAGARSWAIFTSLIQTARLNGVDPGAWLTDALERMASGAVKAKQLDRLLPWNWKAERANAATAA